MTFMMYLICQNLKENANVYSQDQNTMSLDRYYFDSQFNLSTTIIINTARLIIYLVLIT
jgi:hypothetical protein